MKKLLAIVLAIILLLCTIYFSSCTVQRKGAINYQYMYDGMVDLWNFHTTPEFKESSLLGYGEYLYNSYLILFPRETPSTLTDYYFYWNAGIDRDSYAIYFTCELTEDKFNDFICGLNNFKIINGEESKKPIYDKEHFSLPTYILQWVNVGEKWEVLEYIMVDDEKNTIVFVYTMSSLEEIEAYSAYDITPSELDFMEHNFTIYGELEDNDSYIYTDTFDDCIYDILFLDNLK